MSSGNVQGNTKQVVAEQKSKSDTDRVILIVNWFVIMFLLLVVTVIIAPTNLDS